MCRQACVCPSIIVLLLSQQKQLQTKFVLEECKHQSLVSPGKGKKTEKSQSGNVQRGFEKKKKRGCGSAHGKNIQSEKRKMIKVKIKTEMGGTERLGFLLGRGEIEEAQGRGDLATIHHPTLLAAEAQTVCSQQYMHLLVLFQEIITVCVIVCVLCVPGCQFSAKSG